MNKKITKDDFLSTYTNITRLSEGGGGVVYKAFHTRLRKWVILKKMKSVSKSQTINRRETDILKDIHSPYLPGVLDFLEISGQIYTVMDFVEGIDLQTCLDNGKTFSEYEILHFAGQILEALIMLHEQDEPVIHGDIKPANVMLKKDGNIVLIDFNVSLLFGEKRLLGFTEGYSSPEFVYAVRMRNQPSTVLIRPNTDLYSLGATLYALTGDSSFIQTGRFDFEPLKSRYGIPFVEFLKKALETDPNKRFQSARQMLEALNTLYISQEEVKKLKEKKKKYTKILMGASVCCFVLAGLIFYQMIRVRRQEYTSSLSLQSEYRLNGKYKNENDQFLNTISYNSKKIDPYIEHLLALYDAGNYQDALTFGKKDIENGGFKDDEGYTQYLYVKAQSLKELKKIQKSLDTFEELFDKENLLPIYYRDYAMALSDTGKNEDALNIVKRGQHLYPNNLDLDAAYAVINYAGGKKEEAISEMEEVISNTSDPNLKVKASSKLASWYIDAANPDKAKNVLESAYQSEPEKITKGQMLLLCQANIDLANQTGSDIFRTAALDNLQVIIDRGWDDYDTYETVARIQMNTGDLDGAEATLNSMIVNYDQDYRTYKDLAQLELLRNDELNDNMKDYHQFVKDYQKAKSLYNAKKKKEDDSEMVYLRNTYNDIINEGWLNNE